DAALGGESGWGDAAGVLFDRGRKPGADRPVDHRSDPPLDGMDGKRADRGPRTGDGLGGCVLTAEAVCAGGGTQPGPGTTGPGGFRGGGEKLSAVFRRR